MNAPALPVRRLAAEFFVIVTGVLVALGGQAWYEGHEEAEREIDALRAIREDMIRIEEEVSGLIEDQQADFLDLLSTMAILRGQAEPPPDWAPNAGMGFRQLRLPLGSIQSLISSGDTRLVSSPRVRQDLIAYYREQTGLEEWSSQFDAALLDRTAEFIEEIERIIVEAGMPYPEEANGPPLGELPLDRLRASPGIRGYLTWSTVMSSGRVNVLSRAVASAAELRSVIEEEFDARGIEYEPAAGAGGPGATEGATDFADEDAPPGSGG